MWLCKNEIGIPIPNFQRYKKTRKIHFTGILKIIVGIYKSNLVEDITFVPVTISYDRLLEDSLFAREVIGIPKPKESTTVNCFVFHLLSESILRIVLAYEL